MVALINSRFSRTIILLITIFSLSFPAYAKYSGGSGTPEDPYQIATAEDLIALCETPDDYDKHFILTDDIDLDPNLPGRKVFDKAVIGDFTGVFDGNGHTISNLTIDGRDYYLGLFGYTRSGTDVRGVGVIDVNIIGTYDYVGGLVGRNDGNIAASYSTGSVKGRWAVGGLVGDNDGTITMSHTIASVSGYEWVGGLAGLNTGGINSSYSIVSVRGDWSVGGLVGSSFGGSIIGCYNSGSVSGQSRIGGLLGENGEGSSIVASYSNASVSGGNDVGGLVGDNTYGSITSCYSCGSVSGAQQVGGLVGNGGDLDIAGDKIRGGTSASFWDSQSSGQTVSSGGTGLTTTEMQDVKTFLGAGWDFVDEVNNGVCDFWQMSPNDYPRLRYLDGDGPLMPEGMGTSEQPYLIRNAQDLGIVWFKPITHYSLAQSIDLSGITWSTAVIPWFGGNFDGNGHTISQLHIEGGSYLGLFGQLGSGAEVKDLGVVEINIVGSGSYVGGLAGSGGNVNSCYSTGIVSGADCVGGLAGGGSTMKSCYSTATVSGKDYVGGLLGRGSVTSCYSSGSVIGTYCVGGLVGGLNSGNINNSYSSGSVIGNGSVGGLVGDDFRGRITMSYSKASVIGNTLVGGLVGSSFHDVVCPGVFNDSLYCFWDIEASSQTKSRWGIGKTTTEMQTASTFLEAGWDFIGETINGPNDIWKMWYGYDYPCLAWEPGPNTPLVFVDINDPDFYGQMSKYEVTNTQYCDFLNAAMASGDITIDGNDVYGVSGSNSGEDYAGQRYYRCDGSGYTGYGATNGGAARIHYSEGAFSVGEGFGNHPVTYVSWYGAMAFVNYYDYYLPTEEQWQAVADSDGTYIYGCGQTIEPGIANYRDSEHPDGTTPVGSFGVYGYGMSDMAGNVWEWTSSSLDDNRVFRGGSMGSIDSDCDVSIRGDGIPSTNYWDVGFRVCR
jgi:hypothetical protein